MFSPAAYTTPNCEVAVKKYLAGDHENAHYHKKATEITLILTGKVMMCDRLWTEGDIIVVEPHEITDFHALEDTISVVVKIPGELNDKYFPQKKING